MDYFGLNNYVDNFTSLFNSIDGLKNDTKKVAEEAEKFAKSVLIGIVLIIVILVLILTNVTVHPKPNRRTQQTFFQNRI